MEKHLACIDYASAVLQMRRPRPCDTMDELNMARVRAHERLCAAFGIDHDSMVDITDNLPDLSVEDLAEYLEQALERRNLEPGLRPVQRMLADVIHSAGGMLCMAHDTRDIGLMDDAVYGKLVDIYTKIRETARDRLKRNPDDGCLTGDLRREFRALVRGAARVDVRFVCRSCCRPVWSAIDQKYRDDLKSGKLDSWIEDRCDDLGTSPDRLKEFMLKAPSDQNEFMTAFVKFVKDSAGE